MYLSESQWKIKYSFHGAKKEQNSIHNYVTKGISFLIIQQSSVRNCKWFSIELSVAFIAVPFSRLFSF